MIVVGPAMLLDAVQTEMIVHCAVTGLVPADAKVPPRRQCAGCVGQYGAAIDAHALERGFVTAPPCRPLVNGVMPVGFDYQSIQVEPAPTDPRWARHHPARHLAGTALPLCARTGRRQSDRAQKLARRCAPGAGCSGGRKVVAGRRVVHSAHDRTSMRRSAGKGARRSK